MRAKLEAIWAALSDAVRESLVVRISRMKLWLVYCGMRQWMSVATGVTGRTDPCRYGNNSQTDGSGQQDQAGELLSDGDAHGERCYQQRT